MEFFLLIAGLAGLWFGTEATIRGAVTVAERLGIPEFVIGIAVLSIGSDLPELSIAVDGAIKNLSAGDASDVIVGSALGSDLGQIGLVLGITGLFGSLTMPRSVLYQQGVALLGSLLLLGLVGFDGYVSRTEGITLVVIYAIYLLQVLSGAVTIGEGDEGWWSHATRERHCLSACRADDRYCKCRSHGVLGTAGCRSSGRRGGYRRDRRNRDRHQFARAHHFGRCHNERDDRTCRWVT